MFGTELKNPLYSVLSGATALGHLIACLAFIAAFILLWKGSRKAGLWAACGAAAMSAVAFNNAFTREADPYWVRQDIFGDEYLVYPETSDFMVFLSIVLVCGIGWTTFWAVTNKKLLTSGGLLVALIGSAVVATDMLALAFGFGGRASESVFVVNGHLWSVLFVTSATYAVVAVVVLTMRGIRHVKDRAKLDMVTGSTTVSHPSGR